MQTRGNQNGGSPQNMTPEQYQQMLYQQQMRQQQQQRAQQQQMPNQQMPNQMNNQQRTMPNNMTQAQYQQMMYQQQMRQQQMQQMQMQQQNQGVGGFVPPNNGGFSEFDYSSDFEPKKKGKFKKIFIILLIIIALLVVASIIKKKKASSAEDMNFDETSVTDTVTDAVSSLTGNPYADLQSALNNYDAYKIDECVGPENGDSYLAQEWAYVNEVTLKQQFIQKVCQQVEFTSTSENATTVSVPDYAQVTESILADKDYILQLYKSAGYDEKTDYTFDEDCFKLFCQWILDRGYNNVPLPSTSVTISMPITTNVSGQKIIADDGELDMALFATDDLHNAMKEFSKICVQFDGKGYETYTEKKEVHNPDYDEWYVVFKKYYDEDGGHFDPNKSKWEPWYVRDENNNIKYDENGEKLINYYSVKDENGKDWIQPAETILEDVEMEREIEMPWTEERGIPYGIIGTYYIQHGYNGVYDTVFRIGDGSIERPAGFGTPIVTYMKDIEDVYHAVKIALTGYWVQQEAIDYEEAFSSKNRGFSASSPVQLICFEFTVENLEDEPFAFNGTEMCLCNRNANVSNRTGTLYGFYDKGILEPHKKVKLNDWYSSTELEQKYVAWGRDFGRTYPLVYFDCLAGTGEVPTYSAYTQYCGKPEITESAEDE